MPRTRLPVRRAPRPQEPEAIERAYLQAVRSVNADLIASVRSFVSRPFRSAKADNRRADADDLSAFADLDFGVLSLRLGRLSERGARRVVDQFGERIGRFNRRDMERILSIDLADEPPAIRAVLESWRRENVSLIRSIGVRLHDDVHGVIREAVRKGTRVEVLTSRLAERYDVSRTRANVIARDQVTKANADLTQARHEAAGIERYVWSTSRDEKVRDMHAALEGTVHSWDDPPVTNERGDRNHPGGDILCRCVAIPVLDTAPGSDQGTVAGPRAF